MANDDDRELKHVHIDLTDDEHRTLRKDALTLLGYGVPFEVVKAVMTSQFHMGLEVGLRAVGATNVTVMQMDPLQKPS